MYIFTNHNAFINHLDSRTVHKKKLSLKVNQKNRSEWLIRPCACIWLLYLQDSEPFNKRQTETMSTEHLVPALASTCRICSTHLKTKFLQSKGSWTSTVIQSTALSSGVENRFWRRNSHQTECCWFCKASPFNKQLMRVCQSLLGIYSCLFHVPSHSETLLQHYCDALKSIRGITMMQRPSQHILPHLELTVLVRLMWGAITCRKRFYVCIHELFLPIHD